MTREVRLVEIADLQAAPATHRGRLAAAAPALATGWCVPHAINLDGIFGLLTNVVWTSAGPCAVEGFEVTRARLRAGGRHVTVFGVDKFPRMVDYVLPTGVRIADADRVRLGAHLAEGTTVMHEGFVNYNAGTLGASMVEGRISAGVVVGDGSDVGGGASIMGTLSGGGKEVISIGERCLIGANAGIGISLGDDCVVEAGCYVTAGTKVTLPDGDEPRWSRRSSCPAPDNVLFRRNSVTGAVEAVPWQSRRHRAQRRPARQLTARPRTLRRERSWRAARRRRSAVVGGRRRRRGRRPGDGVVPARPPAERVHGDGRRPHASTLDPEQAENAALIAAIAVRRGHAGAGRLDRAGHGVPGVRSSATSSTATATRSASSSSGRRRAGAPASEILDPYYATNAFYDALEKVDGYESMRITEAAQEVQRSGFPDAYADHEADARALASALTGNSRAAFSCAARRRPATSAGRPRPTPG